MTSVSGWRQEGQTLKVTHLSSRLASLGCVRHCVKNPNPNSQLPNQSDKNMSLGNITLWKTWAQLTDRTNRCAWCTAWDTACGHPYSSATKSSKCWGSENFRINTQFNSSFCWWHIVHLCLVSEGKRRQCHNHKHRSHPQPLGFRRKNSNVEGI